MVHEYVTIHTDAVYNYYVNELSASLNRIAVLPKLDLCFSKIGYLCTKYIQYLSFLISCLYTSEPAMQLAVPKAPATSLYAEFLE